MSKQVIDRVIDEIANKEYYIYGVATIEDRAIAGTLDGLKPVIRRALWATYKSGAHSKSKHIKSARVVGDVIGLYHPHGDCLRGDTIVPTLDGKFKTIKELYEQKADERWILAYDERRKSLSPALAYNWKIGHITKHLYRVHMTNGQVIECTGNHPFYVKKHGWIDAKKLVPGQLLVGGYIDTSSKYFKLGFKGVEPLHTVVGNAQLGERTVDEVYHHINDDSSDNRPDNLEIISRGEHALIHGDYYTGFQRARDKMFTKKNTKLRRGIRLKNSRLMSNYNKNLPIIKAFKAVSYLQENGIKITQENYEKLRTDKVIYNLTTLERLATYGYDLDRIVSEGEFKLDTSDAVGLTAGRQPRKKFKVERDQIGYHLFERMALVFKRLLRRYPVDDITWSVYLAEAHRLARYNNLHKTVYTSKKRLKALFGINDIQELLEIIPANLLLAVKEVEHIILDKPEIFYDFTVDKHHNMIVMSPQATGDIKDFCVVHNTAAYGAIVTAANSIQRMIDGMGNWGTELDNAAAYRYTNMRLSQYSDAVFFDPFYMNTLTMIPNFDGSTEEPLNLVSLLPNVLVTGNFGIATGVRAAVPSFTVESLLKVIKIGLDREITAQDCLKHLEFTSISGATVDKRHKENSELLTLFKTGKGKARFDCKITETKDGFRFNQLPPQGILSALDRIRNLPSVADVVDDSDLQDIYPLAYRVVLKRGTSVFSKEGTFKKIKEILASTVHFDTKVTDRSLNKDGTEKISLRSATIPEILNEWLDYRLSIEQSACSFHMTKLDEKISRIDLLRLAIQQIDFIVKLLKTKGLTDEEMAKKLAARMKVSINDAMSVLDFRIRQLKALEDAKLVQQRKELVAEKKKLAWRKNNPEDYVETTLPALSAMANKNFFDKLEQNKARLASQRKSNKRKGNA